MNIEKSGNADCEMRNMKHYISLKNRKELGNVYQCGNSFANKDLVMYVLEKNDKKNRLGMSVSKKIGNSVVRHRVTRLIRETYRLHQMELKTGYDIVIVARVNARNCNYWEMERAFMHLCRLHHLLNKEDD